MIVVVGAGAAGLMAAIHAARAGRQVRVLEGMPDGGRKILISGGGRCNVLPGHLEPSRFVTASSPNTLRKILRGWPLDRQQAFFEADLRIPLVVEPATDKVFPVSNRAREVRDGLVDAAKRAGAAFQTATRVVDLESAPSGWRLHLERGPAITAAKVILATGGRSVPQTGSDGTGLDIARRLGHLIHPTYPALTPLLADPPVHADLAGVSLEVELTGTADGVRRVARGGFLFTHRGYSGPTVLDLSDLATRAVLGMAPRPELTVRWVPDLGRNEWDERLRAPSARRVATLLREQLPDRLADRLLGDAGIDRGLELAQLTKEARLRLVARLTRYPLPWTADEGYRKAEVTGGGVALAAVDPGTLESRSHPGLYLCGEMLDAFGPIGGHNFVWAWATGRAAGLAAAAA
ncbi:MAG: NAD(P)/FAD-dependent oxidoreductase [Gemmatimonadales bacterium]